MLPKYVNNSSLLSTGYPVFHMSNSGMIKEEVVDDPLEDVEATDDLNQMCECKCNFCDKVRKNLKLEIISLSLTISISNFSLPF